jgi:HupE/UreJ protein
MIPVLRLRGVLATLLLLVAGSLLSPAHAHKPSDAYLSLQVAETRVAGQWDIALRDLDFAIGLDRNEDGAITWGEVRQQGAAIHAYALARLGLASGDASCPLTPGALLIDQHSDGAYAVLRFTAECRQRIATLDVNYRLFFDLDAQHKGLLRLNQGTATQTGIFSAGQARHSYPLATPNRWRQLLDYIGEGVWHIWIGFDHILFLVSLLLPAVLLWQSGRWVPVYGFRVAAWDVVRVVTAFTVAHSITLTLATLSVVNLPSRLVESAIALSVVLAALNNLFPRVGRGRWAVAFAFGLIHGFGFASVLADLGLPQQELALSLLGFNVGVELGQLAIVAGFLPVAYLLRATPFYRLVVLRTGSLAIVVLASVWLAERGLDLKLLAF